MAEIVVAPHAAGPPQHRHRQHDEGFYVVSGTVRFTSGEKSFDAGARTLVMVPPGAPHTFANPGDETAIMLNTFTPDLYVHYFRDLHDMITAGQQLTPEVIETGGRVVLVLPFDNRSGQTNLAWIGDSFPDTLSQRLTSAGFLTISRDDRQYALDHLGLPVDFKPSRATTIRIAETLDADYVIVGSYTVNNSRIAVQAQVLEVNKLRLSQPLNDSSELTRLFDVEHAIA